MSDYENIQMDDNSFLTITISFTMKNYFSYAISFVIHNNPFI